MPPAYVKPYLKRQKNDAADAEAICEAVMRPSMRFVETKTPEQQSCLMLHRTRHLFIRQQTAVINAIRASSNSSTPFRPTGATMPNSARWALARNCARSRRKFWSSTAASWPGATRDKGRVS